MGKDGSISRVAVVRRYASNAAELHFIRHIPVVTRSASTSTTLLAHRSKRQPAHFGARVYYDRAYYATKSDSGSPETQARREEHSDRDADKGELCKGADNIQFTWRSAVFTCLMCGGCLAYYEYLRHRKQNESRAITRTERIGVPKLGGPFEFDRKGVVRTDADYKGQYLLIYFGFVNCPDICPQEMEKQTQAVEKLEAEFGPIITPVFISVDPKRDTPPVVDEYCKEFHPRIVGLTGTPEQVKQVSRAYRVYFHSNNSEDKDYLIDHSIIHYFMGKNGKFIDFFGKNMTAQEMTDKTKQAILEQEAKDKERKAKRGVATDVDEED